MKIPSAIRKVVRPEARGQTPPANVVGPLLRQHRVKAGLTQKELAGLCQKHGLLLTRGTLAKIESQVRFIKACELFIIAKVLKVPLVRFYPAGFG